LPYTIVVRQSLLDDELTRLTGDEKRELVDLGLQTLHLDAAGLVQAERYFDRYPAMAWHECLALRMAEEVAVATLLTGDSRLRRIAREKAIDVHGVIWALDEMHRLAIVEPTRLERAIQAWIDDPLVFLPDRVLRERFYRLRHPEGRAPHHRQTREAEGRAVHGGDGRLHVQSRDEEYYGRLVERARPHRIALRDRCLWEHRTAPAAG